MQFTIIWENMMELALSQIRKHRIPVKVIQELLQGDPMDQVGWASVCKTLREGSSLDTEVQKELDAAIALIQGYGGEVTLLRTRGSLTLKESFELATALAMISVRSTIREEFLNRLCE